MKPDFQRDLIPTDEMLQLIGALNAMKDSVLVCQPDRHYLTNRMVIDHASARAFLRHTSESLRDAAMELDDHLGFQRFLATLTRQDGPPAPPPPRPGGRHR
ncbi:hypothetical protein [Streptomyces sp. NPDC001843]|uniref:hypothetical protein n=1 Tax=Streptomyces sp. NPDC001843 TaxID=3364617 RepID=UPI00369E1DC7